MAQSIRIKKGLQANIQALVLEVGELALAQDTGKVYIGTPMGKVLINLDPQGEVEAAVRLKNARTFKADGDAESSAVEFDGTGNVTLNLFLKNIAGLTQGTYTKVGVNAKGQVTSGGNLSQTDIPTLQSSKIEGLGTASAKNVGTASGDVVGVGADGKIDPSVLPAIAITEVFTAANQGEMLALVAQTGDICIRSDVFKNFILRASPADIFENWSELAAPPNSVLSVNSKIGAVTLSAQDVGAKPAFNENSAFNKAFETDSAQIKVNGTASAGISERVARSDHVHPTDVAPLVNAALSGTPTAPTALKGTNTEQVATTKFIMAEKADCLLKTDTIDGGTF